MGEMAEVVEIKDPLADWLAGAELTDTAVLTVKNKRMDDDLLGPTREVVRIEVYSPGSPQGVKALHKAGRASQMRMFRSMRGEFDSKDAENADRERVEKLVAFTKSISGLPLTPAALYGNPKLGYIAAQVEEFIGKAGNF
jgi:hypothetical protein